MARLSDFVMDMVADETLVDDITSALYTVITVAAPKNNARVGLAHKCGEHGSMSL